MTLTAMLTFLRRFAPFIIFGLIAAALLFSVRSCQARHAAQEAAQAKVDAGLASARSESAGDAVGTVSGAADRESAIDATSRENDHAIRSAPGASAPVDPAVAAAGRRALCLRHAYRDSEQCKRLLNAGP